MGYNTYGTRHMPQVQELVRKEVEQCDQLGGLLLLQSMAGGTGAGLGARVAGALREEYESCPMLSCAVWPYESGEVAVQAYNTMLTLSHITEACDGVVLVENEALHQQCRRALLLDRPSYMDLNQVLARALGSALAPARTVRTSTHSPQDDA